MTVGMQGLLYPILGLLGMGTAIGAALGYVARAFQVEGDPVVETINAMLPQTQCGQCGYAGCKPYAEAIAAGDAINKCPPGGEKTIGQLADLLNVKPLPLDDRFGTIEPRKVAVIREAECIGCAKCIPACPVDAILGAPKYMHTVIESECTGCDLCVEPCPVDCIDMVTVEEEFTIAEQPYQAAGHQACINCGLCVDVCPVDILPHELYRACRSSDLEKAQLLNLMHCIECSKCDAVCPSHIPLVHYYQDSKAGLQEQLEEKARADQAKRRFEVHQKRMAKINAEEEQRRHKRAQLARESRHKVSKDSIQSALERVKAKKNNP